LVYQNHKEVGINWKTNVKCRKAFTLFYALKNADKNRDDNFDSRTFSHSVLVEMVVF